MKRRGLLASVSLAALALVACVGASRGPVSLSGTWSVRSDFAAVNRDHTRHATLVQSYAEVIDVYGVLKTPEWRASWVSARSRRDHLSAAATEELLAAEKAADGAFHEIVLLVSTHDRQENDLHRGARATWKTTLIDSQGTEYPATDIIKDRRPRKVIRAEYPDYGDFGQAYLARFPKEAAIYGQGGKAIRVRVSSARGAVTLTFDGS